MTEFGIEKKKLSLKAHKQKKKSIYDSYYDKINYSERQGKIKRYFHSIIIFIDFV